MANDIDTDVKDAKPQAEQIVNELMAMMVHHDPVEAVCALAMAASHFIVIVATEGDASPAAHYRLQPDVQVRLMERVTELCREARKAGAN